MAITIREMDAEDYEPVLKLWQNTEGIGLSGADEREAIHSFLLRNPGLSFSAWDDGKIVGAVLCGHDGRRGYIYHLAVAQHHRRRGLGQDLARRCLSSLDAIGIQKCHIFIFAENQDAIEFWKAIGWFDRMELIIMSQNIPPEAKS
jgi:ribosomal protein S18 acetylase RimI-like enzyme